MTASTYTEVGGNGTIQWSAMGLPTGLSINSSNGQLSGTPTVSNAYSATITATDVGGCTGSKSVTIDVGVAPVITSANSTTFAPGVAGQTFTVTTTGTPTGAAMVITAGSGSPSLVTLTNNHNGTATISGTPASGTAGTSGSPASQAYPVTITANNGVSPNFTQNFTLNITCPAITVSGTGSFTLQANVAMTASTYTEVGGNGTIQWSAMGLPTGLSINSSNGQLSGTPTVSNAYSATITATDVGGCTGSKSVTIDVGVAPVITSANSTTFAPGVAGQTFTVTTTGTPTGRHGDYGWFRIPEPGHADQQSQRHRHH